MIETTTALPALRAVLIAGPTASGKSALALEIASRCSGVIINADALQVYRGLRILTARPSPDEEARVPHRLFGHVPAHETYSTGKWLRAVQAELVAAKAAGKCPIIVGGTGLYFRALTEGLAEIPEVPDDIRREVRADWVRLGPEAFRARLLERDPASASLAPADRARHLRAYEVLSATGSPLAALTAPNEQPLLPPGSTLSIALMPDRKLLYATAERRFLRMIESGALEEARRIAALNLPPDAPALKALGLAELIAHLAGDMSLAAATERAQQRTRNYVKRQLTWIRHQMPSFRAIDPQETGAMEALIDGIFQFRP